MPRTPPTSDTGKRDVGIFIRAWRWYRANRHGFRTPQHWQPVTGFAQGGLVTAAAVNTLCRDNLPANIERVGLPGAPRITVHIEVPSGYREEIERRVRVAIKAGLQVGGSGRLEAQRYAICSERARIRRRTFCDMTRTFVVDRFGVCIEV